MSGVKIFYWCQETALVPFETGIQRVVRQTAVELSRLSSAEVQVVPVSWNARLRRVESLPTSPNRGSCSLEAMRSDRELLFVPEIPLALIGVGLDPFQLGRAYGMRTAALVHDLIPIKLAGDYPPETFLLYRSYYRRLASADLVIATTHYVAADLRDFLHSEQLRVPLIEVINLPAELPSVPRRRLPPPPRAGSDPLHLVAVATWEPRKNIQRLLKAIARVRLDRNIDISLDLIGRRGGFPDYDEGVLSIAAQLPTVRLLGTVSDAELAARYADCHASVYPSLEEGFGLPILESLWLGRPCLCHRGSSMAEIAPGGGTLQIDMAIEDEIAESLQHLYEKTDIVDQLALEAVARPLKTWADFADSLLDRLQASSVHDQDVCLQ